MKKKQKRMASLALCGVMAVSACSQSAFAATELNTIQDQVHFDSCNHEHNEDCYEMIESCKHTHTESCCGEDVATGSNMAEPDECPHICDEAEGCMTKELACTHEHDDTCGYEEEKQETEPLQEQELLAEEGLTEADFTEPDIWNALIQDETINPDGNDTLSDKEVAAVTSITLEQVSFQSLQDLNQFPNLSFLSISNCAGLPEQLDFSELTTVTSISCSGIDVQELQVSNENLSGLNLYDCPNVTSITVTAPAMTNISITGCSSLTDISLEVGDQMMGAYLSNCETLSNVTIDGGISSFVTSFSGCSKLNHVSINGADIKTSSSPEDAGRVILGEIEANYSGTTDTLIKTSAIANNGYRLKNWIVDGADFGSSRNLEHITGTSTNIIAAFEESTAVTDGVEINEENFPDWSFRQYVLDSCDVDHDGVLSDGEIEAVLSMDLSGVYAQNISGIRFFTSMQEVTMSQNPMIETIDLSHNAAIQRVNVSGSYNLQNVTVAGCNEIRSLNMDGTAVSGLDLAGCSQLEELYCAGTKIAALDISGLESLKILECGDCSYLESLTLEGATGLERININGSAVHDLTLSGLNALISMTAANSELQTLTMEQCGALTTLDAGNSELAAVTMIGVPMLNMITLSGNPLTQFTMEEFTITVNPADMGTFELAGWYGTPNGSGYANMQARPAAGYEFTGWTVANANGTEEFPAPDYQYSFDSTNGTATVTGNFRTPHVHQWEDIWNSDTEAHWHNCSASNCPITDRTEKEGFALHTGGTATCKEKAVCEVCGQVYGDFDRMNHNGGTEIRGAIEATTEKEGYTGDTYCLGCGERIATGSVIPKKEDAGGNNQGSGDTEKPDSGDSEENNEGSGDNNGNSGSDSGNGNGSGSGSDGSGSGSGSGGSSGGSSSHRPYNSSSGPHVAVSTTAQKGTWSQTEGGWKFQPYNADAPKNAWMECIWENESHWYYFDENGIMKTGWFTDADGRTYYLHNIHDGKAGHMYTGWHWIDGKCYYFETVKGQYIGHLYKSQKTPDNFNVNEQGEWVVNGIVQTHQ